jgi:hypothetical protein
MDGLFLQSSGLFGSLGSGGGAVSAIQTFQTIIIGIIIGVVVLSFVGFFAWKRKENRRFNINLQIIVPRSDGKIIEWYAGKGAFNKSKAVGGIRSFLVRRKGVATVEMPPPRSDFIIAPNNTLLLAQKGIDDFEPIMPYNLSMASVGGKKVPILNLHAINQDATAWAFDIEETAKQRFTFASIWDKYQTAITMAIFVFIMAIALYINWIGQKDVVTGLQSVADSLKGTAAPIITPGG